MRASRKRPHPRYGQHFLADGGVCRKILDALGESGGTVVEIGPGRGALTRPLLARGVRVVAFEIDAALAAALRREFAGAPLSVLTADALEVDVAEALADAGVSPPVPLVGNLPYDSATPMLRTFVRKPGLFSRLVVMIQKEVADRLLARPRTPAYGYLTLDVGAHAAARRVFDVRPGAFLPPPGVMSTVVELTPHPPAPDAVRSLAVASAGFTLRRKTLVNALTPPYGRENAAAAVAALGLLPTVRAEELTLAEFAALSLRLDPARNAKTKPEES